MKIRNGFVSNSSSSSFIIVSKNGKLTKEKIMKVLNVNKKSPMYSMAEDVTKSMLYADKYTPEKFLDNYSYGDTIEEMEKEFKEDYPSYYKIYESAKKNNWTIYMGSADDVDDPILCEMDLHYEDNEIIIEKDGGY